MNTGLDWILHIAMVGGYKSLPGMRINVVFAASSQIKLCTQIRISYMHQSLPIFVTYFQIREKGIQLQRCRRDETTTNIWQLFCLGSACYIWQFLIFKNKVAAKMHGSRIAYIHLLHAYGT